MHAGTVAIDLAKEVFELAFADARGRVSGRKRLSRKAFARVMEQRQPTANPGLNSHRYTPRELPDTILLMANGSVPERIKPMTIPALQAA